jgi:Icc-related predicted phosphoesterase
MALILRRTRLFFASDIHGSERCFRKFINIPRFYGATVLILGGDLTGKAVVPIVKRRDGVWESHFFGVKSVAKSDEELKKLVNTIGSSGFYPYCTGSHELEELGSADSNIKSLFQKLALERLEHWMELAKKKLRGSDVKCFISPGNDDFPLCDQILKKCQDERVVYSEAQSLFIDAEHEMITIGWSNETPWNSSRETTEMELARMIDELSCDIHDKEKSIFNIHVPPINSGLDATVKLNSDLKPVTSGGQVEKTAAGSTAVREAIEKYEPILGLHGHIHESPGFYKLGRTLCLNPGSEYTEGILRGVLVEMDSTKIHCYQLTSG